MTPTPLSQESKGTHLVLQSTREDGQGVLDEGKVLLGDRVTAVGGNAQSTPLQTQGEIDTGETDTERDRHGKRQTWETQGETERR